LIRALLFDFDGVIVDTEVPTYQSWRDIYKEYGVDLALSAWLPAVGTGSSVSGAFDAVAHLEALTGGELDREALISRRAERKLELCDSAPLLPGVKGCLAEAKRLMFKTGIVTRNRDEWVERHCRRVGLHHRWDAVVCANAEPTTDKSALYRKALALLDVQASEALAFEDSPSGVRAAKKAGLRCVAIPNEITREAAFEDADLVLRSLADQPLEDLVAAG
jgi:beta-phosphoglucomutase-like phosphatase (HAD superfamily)